MTADRRAEVAVKIFRSSARQGTALVRLAPSADLDPHTSHERLLTKKALPGELPIGRC
jgi:hypothetical protein